MKVITDGVLKFGEVLEYIIATLFLLNFAFMILNYTGVIQP